MLHEDTRSNYYFWLYQTNTGQTQWHLEKSKYPIVRPHLAH